MKTQYLAKVLLEYCVPENQWANAVFLTSGKRYAKTHKEAQAAIQALIRRGEQIAALRVVEWKILSRSVTDWEPVSDEK